MTLELWKDLVAKYGESVARDLAEDHVATERANVVELVERIKQAKLSPPAV